MAVVYDEVYISTMREIRVCKETIKRLSKSLGEMERRYGISTKEFMDRFGGCGLINSRDYEEWHDSFVGLKSWEKRLKEFEEILIRYTG